MKHVMHGDERIQTGLYGRRGLERTIPGLARFLEPGQRVLDLGCGPGTITLEVAAVVHPGAVVGLDREQSSLDKATTLAAAKGRANLSFQKGDTYKLPFADGDFDLAYANNVMQWLKDPAAGLREMARVTKPGGRVAVQESDWGTVVMHPAAPAFEQWIRAIKYFDGVAEIEVHGRYHYGRELYSHMVAAGLREVKAEGHATTYCGDPDVTARVRDLMLLHLELEGPYGHLNRRMLKDGIIESGLLPKAKAELIEAFKHPAVFGSMTAFFVSGTV